MLAAAVLGVRSLPGYSSDEGPFAVGLVNQNPGMVPFVDASRLEVTAQLSDVELACRLSRFSLGSQP